MLDTEVSVNGGIRHGEKVQFMNFTMRLYAGIRTHNPNRRASPRVDLDYSAEKGLFMIMSLVAGVLVPRDIKALECSNFSTHTVQSSQW